VAEAAVCPAVAVTSFYRFLELLPYYNICILAFVLLLVPAGVVFLQTGYFTTSDCSNCLFLPQGVVVVLLQYPDLSCRLPVPLVALAVVLLPKDVAAVFLHTRGYSWRMPIKRTVLS
jgi:hypothetical protein